MAPAVDEERGRSGHGALLPRPYVERHARLPARLGELIREAPHAQAEVARDAEELVVRQLLLMREQLVVVLPEATLRRGRLARLRGGLRHRVALADREVPEHEAQLVAQAVAHAPHARLR